jgi:hypothetical protein
MPVWAAPTVSDKSADDLFHPTAADQVRALCTDRPTRSNFPCTVDAGYFQYEADAFNWTYDNAGGVTRNTYLFTNPTFKIGLTNRSDFEINIVPFEDVVTHNGTTHQTTENTGPGDLYARYKYNLFGNDSGGIAVTLLPYVKIPTAPPGIGNQAFEEGLIVPVSFNLPKGFLLVLDPEVDAFKDAAGSSYHGNYQGLVNISHTVFSDSITAYGEWWTDANKDPSGTVIQDSLDFAVTWLARPNLQLDVGTNIGLNAATPDVESYVGISKRF